MFSTLINHSTWVRPHFVLLITAEQNLNSTLREQELLIRAKQEKIMIPAEIEQIQIGVSWWNKAKIIRLGNVSRFNQSLNLNGPPFILSSILLYIKHRKN